MGVVNIRKALAVVCLGMSPGAFAGAALPTIETRIDPEAFESPLAAVQSAGNLYLEVSRRSDREVVGGILRNASGEYRYTVGWAEPEADEVRFRIVIAPGQELVAFWHTHGRAGPARELFSEQDTRLVAGQGLPLYLITPRSRIRLLQPGRIRRRGPRESATLPRGAATGVMVGRIR